MAAPQNSPGHPVNATSRMVVATVVAGIILSSFGIAYSSIIDRIDGLSLRIVKVLDDHETRLRIVEREAARRPQ